MRSGIYIGQQTRDVLIVLGPLSLYLGFPYTGTTRRGAVWYEPWAVQLAWSGRQRLLLRSA